MSAGIAMPVAGMIDREEFFRVMRKRGHNPLDDLDSDDDDA